jgi:hypothetical protein
VARKSISLSTGGNGAAALRPKTSKNQQNHSQTEGKACFLNFTHTHSLSTGSGADRRKFGCFSRAQKAWHVNGGTYCAEMTSSHNPLKTLSKIKDKYFPAGSLGVR